MNYGQKKVLKQVSFSINQGEIFTFIGPSGSGKTTILRLIDMLERPTAGRVLIGGVDVSSLRERDKVHMRRKMSIVFQKPAPLRGSVSDNVAMGLRFRNVDEREIALRTSEALQKVGLGEYGERNAGTLSGGEMQRVAIARAIATRPEVLLLDEPTANLDPVSTEKIEKLILTLNEQCGITIVLSTHDMVQGQRLADRIGVVIDGRIGQIGTSMEIFYHPVNRSVARMAGVENILEGTIAGNDGGLATVDINGIRISAPSQYPPKTPVVVYLRPEDITFHGKYAARTSARNEMIGRVIKVVPLGPMVRITVDVGMKLTAVITQRSFEDLGLALGEETGVAFKASAIHVLKRESRS